MAIVICSGTLSSVSASNGKIKIIKRGRKKTAAAVTVVMCDDEEEREKKKQ